MPADAELSSLLSRRQRINDELEEGKEVKKQYKFVNIYTEFHELSRREIKQYEETFNRWASFVISHIRTRSKNINIWTSRLIEAGFGDIDIFKSQQLNFSYS